VGATMIRLTILGQPCSKANSRQIVTIAGRPTPIKSKEALAYERDALRQIPPAARQRLEGRLRMTLRIWYASERPDLDESLVLDVLQDRYKGAGEARVLVQAGVYRNDRQVRERHVYHAVDRANPRAEIEIEAMEPQQVELPMPVSRETEDLWS
jgi:Holliday junction resolvase RusA-like endonuclease